MKSEEIKKIVAKSENAIVESYEPDRTKVMVEFEADESELGVKTTEVEKKTSEVRVKTPEVREKTLEVKMQIVTLRF